MDNEPVKDQLNRNSGVNRDDIREMANSIWAMVGKDVRFLWIPREQNKTGKMLGS